MAATSEESPRPEVLESGTSLAEQEHDGEIAPSNSPLSNLSNTAASQITQDGAASTKKTLECIEALRAEIAGDLLDAGNISLAFASPFDVPPGALPIGNEGSKKDRKLQVPLVYCDHTASNRTVQSVENYMLKTCLPLYGNTHTNTSITGAQSTAFVAEARQIVAEETNARITGKASLDVVLFSGSGTTAAVELLIDCMGLMHASEDPHKKPIVFVGPHEHHSNIVPWRETGCEIVTVPECVNTGTVDFEAFEKLLQKSEYDNRLKMGTFTAASNVNGKILDVDRVSATLHRHDALAFFDYATGAPYMSIDMNPPPSGQYATASLVAKDAVFLSPHKMIGGIGTPGVLIIKKHLVNQQNAPSRSGGGTVFYVSNTHHRFLSNRIDRYEGGTPNVAGIFRVGLAFLFKRQVEQKYQVIFNCHQGTDSNAQDDDKEAEKVPPSLQKLEYQTYNRVARYLKQHAPNLVLLDGDNDDTTKMTETPHLPIFSFLIRCGNRFLHYNYVCALLNDVFGIQSRGGCQCAGPYSQRLLGLTKASSNGEIPNEQNEAIENALVHYKERAELLRPGYTRLSLPFKGLQSQEVEYVMKALVWIAKNGWALMCHYRCNHRTGEWRHAARQGKPLGRTERKWLSHYDRTMYGAEDTANSSKIEGTTTALQNALANANCILEFAKSDQRSIAEAIKMNDSNGAPDSDELEKLRWYMYPKEIAMHLSQGVKDVPGTNSSQLLGGLTPLSSKLATPQTRQSNDEVAIDTLPVGEKKRKQDSLEDGESERLPRQRRRGEHSATEEHDEEEKSATNEMDVAIDDTIVRDTKNEKKKPARGATSWGQGNFVAPKLSPGSGHDGQSSSNASAGTAGDSKTGSAKKGKQKHRHTRPPPKMMRQINQAVIQWDMLKEGDRLLLGLSGGKDSLSLLHGLMECQRKMPIKFEIEVCTVDPMTPSFDPSPLIPYVESLGLKYHYIREDIVERANTAGKDGKIVSSLCSYCARMKRGLLYGCARENKCNKLVLAQHLDDCAESFLMSVMHNGCLRTMKANYKIDAGDLSVIRPLVYCRESLMTNFATSANLPVINENCPACFEEPKERARTKKLLNREETLYPNFYDNMRRSLIPLMHDDMSGILRGYTEEAVSKSRKAPHQGGKRNAGKDGGKRQRGADSLKPASSTKEGEDKTAFFGAGNAAASNSALEDASDGGNTKAASISSNPRVSKKDLASATEEELLMELAKRKADCFRAAASKDSDDPTGQVCSLNGGNGTIPCRELME